MIKVGGKCKIYIQHIRIEMGPNMKRWYTVTFD